MSEPFEALRRALHEGKRGALATVTGVVGAAPSRRGSTLAFIEDGMVHGSLGCEGFDRSAVDDAQRSVAESSLIYSTYDWEDDAQVMVEIKPYLPGDVLEERWPDIPELLVVGTGPVARALVALGEAMGYQVRVAAGPRSPSVGEFDGADEVIVTPTAVDVEALRPGANTYVVICGHDEEFSQPVLRALLPGPVPYLGMMGSKRHTGHLIEELRALGFEEDALSKVHSPVGLPIGSETPEEIAVSALAQIVQVRRQSRM